MRRLLTPSGQRLYGQVLALVVACVLPAALAACSLPAQFNVQELSATPASSLETATFSPTASTASVEATPTLARPSPLPSLSLATLSLAPSLTPVPSSTFTSSPTSICNRALPGSPLDITIPDDSTIVPGQIFSKTWRLQNAGSCQWTASYAVVFFSGDLLGAARVNSLPEAVQPGQTVDITVDMVAPLDSGAYQGNWELSDPQGALFGLGPDGNAPFWVRIQVVAPATLTPTNAATITTTPTPSVYITGLSNLKPNDTLDLDTNKVNTGKTDELLYLVGTDKTHRLVPQNGSRMAVFGMTAPTFLDCSTAALPSDPIALDSIPQGTYFCYNTNIGLPGWARLVALNAEDNTLTLEILTWGIP